MPQPGEQRFIQPVDQSGCGAGIGVNKPFCVSSGYRASHGRATHSHASACSAHRGVNRPTSASPYR